MRQPFSLNIYCKDTNEKEQAMHHKMNICREQRAIYYSILKYKTGNESTTCNPLQK